MPASPCRSGKKRGGSIPTTRVDGFNGIAAITWAGVCPKRTPGRLDGGRLSVAIRCKSDAIVSLAIKPVDHDNDKRCCTGPMIAGKSEAFFELRVTRVRFGSLADIEKRISDVRFTPESRHSVRWRKESAKCPLQPRGDHHSRYPIFH